MHRRDFLRIALQAAVAPAPVRKANITSSVLLSTLRGSFDEKVAAAARAGVQSIELGDEYKGWSDAEVGRVKRMVRSYNMTIDAIAGDLDYARKLDVPQVILLNAHPATDITILLTSMEQVKEANDPKVRLLFDTKNQKATVAEAAPYTAVFRISEAPHPDLYKDIKKANYTGYVCFAYPQQGEQIASLIKQLNEFRTAII